MSEPDAPIPVIFIGGFGRSGSTLLERVLGQVPGHVPVGELVHLPQRGLIDNEACGCGLPFSDCPFWTAVGEEAFGGWAQVKDWRELQFKVDRRRYVPDLIVPVRRRFRTDLHEHADRLGRLYRAIATVSGAKVLVDSSKHFQTAFLLHHVPGIAPRVVHLVRDSRGVAYSWSKEITRPESGSDELMPQYSPWSAAEQYDAYNLALHQLWTVHTPRVFLRYESFLADPRNQLTRLLERLKLPATAPAALDYLGDDWVELTPNHSVAGNPMRFKVGRMELRTDDAWRQQLPARNRRVVTAVTSPLLLSYGYLGKGRRS